MENLIFIQVSLELAQPGMKHFRKRCQVCLSIPLCSIRLFLYTHWSTVDVSATGLGSQPCGKLPKRTLPQKESSLPTSIFFGIVKLRAGNQASFRLFISMYVYYFFRGYVKLGSCIPDYQMNSIQNLRPTPLQLALQCSRAAKELR